MPMTPSPRPAILITGAAAGIGRAVAERFARAGWFVGLFDLDEAAVSALLQAHGQGDGGITPAGLRWCIERCIAAGHVDRLDLARLKPERRPVIGGGLAILSALTAQFGIDRLMPAKGALRQGVIVDLHQRLQAQPLVVCGDLHNGAAA